MPCDAGTYAPHEGMASCLSCDVGTFAPDPNRSSCVTCPAGSYCPSKGLSSPVLCPAGSFGTIQGGAAANACSLCPPGTAANITGKIPQYIFLYVFIHVCIGSASSAVCQPCGPGEYTNSAGSAICSPCSPGTYSNDSNAVQCQLCPANTFNPNSGERFISACSACATALVSAPGSSHCSLALSCTDRRRVHDVFIATDNPFLFI